MEAELDRIGHALQPLDIVLVNTARRRRYGHDDYVAAGCGMGREATLYLLERGVRVTGTDALELGRAVRPHRRSATPRRTTPAIIWEGHKAGREIGYCHMEKLHNLEALPPTASRSLAFR